MSKAQFDHLQIEYRSPHELKPHPYNARVHSKRQIRKLAKSMKRFGCVNPALISDANEIIAGFARVRAAELLGLKLIPTIRLSRLTPAERLAYNLADNRLSDFAKYDRGLLAIQIEQLTNLRFDEIEITGFSPSDIDIGGAEKRAVGSDDALPATREVVVSRKGDVWILGHNRLFCGDPTAAADCQILLRGEQADIVLTDALGILPTDFVMADGEREDKFIAFLSSVLRAAKESSKPGTIMFVFTDWYHLFGLLTAARAQQLPLKDLVVWAKRDAGRDGFYRPQHELIAVLNGDAAHLNAGRHRSNLWKYPSGSSDRAVRGGESGIHRAWKTVALLADVIRDVSRPNAIVFDPFTGEGSTLIAAEKTGRRAYLLEPDPICCDAIIRRFEAYTGKTAQLDGDGPTFKEAENIRAADSANLKGSIRQR